MPKTSAKEQVKAKVQASSTLTCISSPSQDPLPPNSWCPISGELFQVRQGPDYPSNKQKDSSQPSLLQILGIDVFKTQQKSDHIMQHITPPPLSSPLVTQPDLYCPNYLVLNVMLPAYSPPNPVWGSPKDNGPNYSLVLYYAFTQEVYDGMRDRDSPSLSLLRDWLQADTTSKEDYPMRGRLKGIPVIQNPEDASLGLLSSLVNMYNAKPFLTGPKHHRFVRGEDYLEVDVDIHRYMYLARSTFNSLVSEVPKLRLNFALVVEGREDEELPEQVLAAV